MLSTLMMVIALVIGHAIHVLKKVIEVRRSDQTMTITRYLSEGRYKAALSVCGSIIGFMLILDRGIQSVESAFLVGYFADSLLDAAPNRNLWRT